MLKKFTLTTALIIAMAGSVMAQVNIKDSAITTPVIYATYAYQFLFGDLSERFGGNSSIGGGFMIKTATNWVFGAEGTYMFGGKVKNSDSILKALYTKEGFIIAEDGFYADEVFSERGWTASFKVGKIIPVFAHNPNSGITVFGGIGYMEDKIRLHTIETKVPAIEGDYKKGYDKLNGGLFVTGSAGYWFMSNSRLINFYVGAEFMQAWTKSKRDFDFATEKKDDKSYSSQFLGIKIKWMIPLYQRKPKDFYLY